MNENNSHSVYYLISDLCKELLRDVFFDIKENETDVRKLRSKSFEILLNKSMKKSGKKLKFDNTRNLENEICLNRLNKVTDPKKRKKYDLIEQEMQLIKNKDYFNNEPGMSVLGFLLSLEREKDKDQLLDQSSNLLIPGPFSIQISRFTNCYPIEYTCAITPPEFFPGIHSMKNKFNPYMPNFHRHQDYNQLKKVDKQFAIEELKMKYNELNESLLHSYNSIAPKKSTAFKFQTNSLFHFEFNEIYIQAELEIEIKKSKLQYRCLNQNWENLQQEGIVLEKNYVTETNCSNHLQEVLAKALGTTYEAKIVSLPTFLNDIKYLCVGIQSNSFYADKNAVFYMLSNITIKNISPSLISNYVFDFLQCGYCYRRLKLLTVKKNFKFMFDGFIYKALCAAIDEYLLLFHEFVFAFQDTTILNFSTRIKKMMNQIINFTHTLGINPYNPTIPALMGQNFLGFLYQKVMKIHEKDLIMLLVFILKRCCHVYFKYLHKWIFYGNLDDNSNELFICFVDNYRPKTKYFYDKAYFVRKEYVPGFIQNYDDQILLCGKYTMLLKEFKPYHPLFDMQYPDITVSLSFEEIESMSSVCKQYYQNARKTCGKPITIRDLLEIKKEARKEFVIESSEKNKKNMEKWNNEQTDIMTSKAIAKQERFEQIVKNLNDVKKRKLDERKANIQLELKILREAEQQEDNLIHVENINLRKRIEYYQEMNDILDEHTGKIKKNLETKLNSKPLKKSITPDPVFNDNNQINYGYKAENNESILDKINENIQKLENPLFEIIDNCAEINLNDLNANSCKAAPKTINNELNETVLHVDTSNNNKQLTEALKIKMKVLEHEYYYSPRDVNSNAVEDILPVAIITEAQKNRNKMMGNNLFTEFNREPKINRLNLNLDSDLSRNRRKILESEYNIMTGVYNTPRGTPMSTTSDNDFGLVKQDYLNKNENDIINGNTDDPIVYVEAEGDDLSKELYLDLPSVRSNSNSNIPSTTGSSIEQESCDYNTPKSTQSSDEFFYEASSTVINSPTIEKEFNYYKACEQLVTSNFKCYPRNELFRLQHLVTCESKNEDKSDKSDKEKEKNLVKNHSELNSLNSITIANFLQTSVVTPLTVHMEILSNEVMRVFLDDLDILGHFSSLRNYFFLMDGEFGLIICDGIIASLENGATPKELFSFQTLHTILNKALGSIIIGNDKNASRLSFIVGDRPEIFDLSSPSVLNPLTLSYSIDWPLNLILNPETIEHYVIVFKYLIKVRRISWIMEKSHQLLKEVVKKAGKSPQYLHVQQIRHKFLHFVNVLKHHITSNALEASWKTFEDDLVTAESIEDIYRKHSKYIKRIMFLCMLNRQSVDFYNTIETIFKITLRFYGNLKSRQWKQKLNDKNFTHSRYDKLLNDEIEFDKFIKYTIYLGNKIVRRGYQEEIGEFISLINYNNYYVPDGYT